MKRIDIAHELEKMIALYFNGKNYEIEGVDLSREASREVAYALIEIYQRTERMVLYDKVKKCTTKRK